MNKKPSKTPKKKTPKLKILKKPKEKSKTKPKAKPKAKPKIKPKENQLPKGVDEKDFLRVLDNISKRLAYKFRFAYHNFDDMKQQAAIFAIEGLEKYDNSRPLENFLWTHVRNRLFNYKRNNFQRPDKPCLTCPLFDKAYKNSSNQCSKFLNKDDCQPYASWSKRNDAKKNIIQPSNIIDDGFHADKTKDTVKTTENKEIIDFLDQYIQQEYRESYLKLKHGTKIQKQELSRLQAHISKIMEEQKWTKQLPPKKEDS